MLQKYWTINAFKALTFEAFCRFIQLKSDSTGCLTLDTALENKETESQPLF